MKYSIQGDTLPVVVCELDAGEKIRRRKRNYTILWNGSYF